MPRVVWYIGKYYKKDVEELMDKLSEYLNKLDISYETSYIPNYWFTSIELCAYKETERGDEEEITKSEIDSIHTWLFSQCVKSININIQ